MTDSGSKFAAELKEKYPNTWRMFLNHLSYFWLDNYGTDTPHFSVLVFKEIPFELQLGLYITFLDYSQDNWCKSLLTNPDKPSSEKYKTVIRNAFRGLEQHFKLNLK